MTTTQATSNIPTITADLPRWQPATWENYLTIRDNSHPLRVRLFFDGQKLFVEMGSEGINHSSISDLFAMLFFIWFSPSSGQTAQSLGRCLLEKPPLKAASPDLVLYIGEGVPQWEEGQPRRINLNRERVPDLVGEISDTTLATDLDEKKRLYAELEIPEYWVVSVLGKRVLAFRLQSDKTYQQVQESVALSGLPISLLEQTLQRLSQGTNISAASWFARSIER